MQPLDIALLAGLVLGFGLVSKRIESTMLTPPIVAVVAGLALGPPALGWLKIDLGEGPLHALAELTLVLVLFGDATRIGARVLFREAGLPARMLSLGLLGSLALGTLFAKLAFPQLSLWEAATLAAVLAPTDGRPRAGRRLELFRSPAHSSGAQRGEWSQRRDRVALRAGVLGVRQYGRAGIAYARGVGHVRARPDHTRSAGRDRGRLGG